MIIKEINYNGKGTIQRKGHTAPTDKVGGSTVSSKT